MHTVCIIVGLVRVSLSTFKTSKVEAQALWAQSLLRMKRSIDELYSLCEFESDALAVEQVVVFKI